MIVKPAPPCLAADSVEQFSDTALGDLWAYGVRGLFVYQGCSLATLQRYLAKNFWVGFVGYSRSPGWSPSAATGAADAASALDHVHGTLGVPKGVTIFDDLEAPLASAGVRGLLEHIDTHAAAIHAAADTAADYVGEGCGLTSAEWQSRPNVHAYWKSGSRVVDRFGAIVEPQRGWSVVQGRPFNLAVGAAVDLDFVCEDYFGASILVVSAGP